LVSNPYQPSVARSAASGVGVDPPGQGGLAGRVGADLGAQQTGDPALGGDGGQACLDRPDVGVVAAAQPVLQALKVAGGSLQLAGPGGGGRTGTGAGPHQYPTQPERGIGLALAGDGHGALQHPVTASLRGWLALVAFGDVVDRSGRRHVQVGEHLGRQVGLGRRSDEVHLGGQDVAQVGVGDQLGVAHQQEPPFGGQLVQRPHRPGDLGDLAGAAVVGPVEDGHAPVAADPKAGLDLFEVGAAILGMAEPGRDEALLGLLVGAVQRDRGHVPVQPRDLEAEGGDRAGADRPHQLVEFGRDGVQGTPDAVVVERVGAIPKTSSTAHARAHSSTRHSGVGEVSRLATRAWITCPWVRVATSRIGQARSTIPARSSRRQKLATTGSAPSVFSTLGGP
jgi:hypothetical protein